MHGAFARETDCWVVSVQRSETSSGVCLMSGQIHVFESQVFLNACFDCFWSIFFLLARFLYLIRGFILGGS